MSNLLSLTSAQLIKAANIKDKIEALTKELNGLLGGSAPVAKAAPVVKAAKKKRKMSAAGRASIIAAQKARWAKIKAAKASPKAAKPVQKPAKKKTRKISAEGITRIKAAQKARWAKIKAAKK